MTELCPHGRHEGAVCLECDVIDDYIKSLNTGWDGGLDGGDDERNEKLNKLLHIERQPTGLDAPYYDLPPNVRDAQDLIEYLGLNFANGNIMKSLIRQYGSQTKATDDLYEAEKRFYFAQRELLRVQTEQRLSRPDTGDNVA